jgi:hypothetical protein
VNVFNFISPSSNADRFFGVGERKGEFFLQDRHTYSLYNNRENAEKSFQVGRVVEYGRNGFFPIIYSQI